MIRLVVSNQRGGATKTTTTHTLGRCFADQGLKVLFIDTDSQGSLSSVLGVNTQNHLHQFVVENYRWKDCIVNIYPGIDILCSNRQTVETEGVLMALQNADDPLNARRPGPSDALLDNRARLEMQSADHVHTKQATICRRASGS